MKFEVTAQDREQARKAMERVARGLIDDTMIDAPDDEETAELKRTAREQADLRRAAARSRAVRRRKQATSAA